MQLRDMLKHGFKLNIYCEARDPKTGIACCHNMQVPVESLIQRFGWDFDFVKRRHWFLQHFVCAKCGAREATMRLQNPMHVPVYDPAWNL